MKVILKLCSKVSLMAGFTFLSLFCVAEELKGLWVSDASIYNWHQVVGHADSIGVNNLFVNFASAGMAFYKSDYLPEKDVADSLENLIRYAHEKGIYVHAKVLSFFMFWAPSEQIDKMKKAGRLLRSAQNKIQMQAKTPWLDPSQAQNRELIKNVIREILNKFDVDGIQLDYIRFFEEKGLPENIMKIRQSLLTNFVNEAGDLIKETKPKVRYSACVFYNLERSLWEMGQDWQTWARLKTFNFIVPMNYTTHNKELIKWLNKQEHIIKRQTAIYSGLGAYMGGMTPEKLLSQIALIRKADVPGYILFGYSDSFVKKMIPFLKKKLDK